MKSISRIKSQYHEKPWRSKTLRIMSIIWYSVVAVLWGQWPLYWWDHKWDRKDFMVEKVPLVPWTKISFICNASTRRILWEEQKADILSELEKIVDEYKKWFDMLSLDAKEKRDEEKIRKWQEVSDWFESRVSEVYGFFIEYDLDTERDRDFLERFFIEQSKIRHSFADFVATKEKKLYDISTDKKLLQRKIESIMNFKCAKSVDLEKYTDELRKRYEALKKKTEEFIWKIGVLESQGKVLEVKPLNALDYEFQDILYEFGELELESDIVKETSLSLLMGFQKKRLEFLDFPKVSGDITDYHLQVQKIIEGEKDEGKKRLLQSIYVLFVLGDEIKKSMLRFKYFDWSESPRLPYAKITSQDIDPWRQTEAYIKHYLRLFEEFPKFRRYIQRVYRGTLEYNGGDLYPWDWQNRYIKEAIKGEYFPDISWGYVHRKILDKRQVKPKDSQVLVDMYKNQVSQDILETPTTEYVLDRKSLEETPLAMLWEDIWAGTPEGNTFPYVDGIFLYNTSESTRVNELTQIILSRYFWDDILASSQMMSGMTLNPLLIMQSSDFAQMPVLSIQWYLEFLSDVASIQLEIDREILRILWFAIEKQKQQHTHPWYEFTADFMMGLIPTRVFQSLNWKNSIEDIQNFIFSQLTEEEKQFILDSYIHLGKKLIEQMPNIKEFLEEKVREEQLKILPSFVSRGLHNLHLSHVDITGVITFSDTQMKEKLWKIDLGTYYAYIYISDMLSKNQESMMIKMITFLKSLKSWEYYNITETGYVSSKQNHILSFATDILKDAKIDWEKNPKEIYASLSWEKKREIRKLYTQIWEYLKWQIILVFRELSKEAIPRAMQERNRIHMMR